MAIDEQGMGGSAIAQRTFWDRNRERLIALQYVLRGNPNMAIGLLILLLAVLMAAFAPVIATDEPKELFTESKAASSFIKCILRDGQRGQRCVLADDIRKPIVAGDRRIGDYPDYPVRRGDWDNCGVLQAGGQCGDAVYGRADGVSVIPACHCAGGAAGRELPECGACAIGGGDAARGANRSGIGAEPAGAAVCGGCAGGGREAVADSVYATSSRTWWRR